MLSTACAKSASTFNCVRTSWRRCSVFWRISQGTPERLSVSCYVTVCSLQGRVFMLLFMPCSETCQNILRINRPYGGTVRSVFHLYIRLNLLAFSRKCCNLIGFANNWWIWLILNDDLLEDRHLDYFAINSFLLLFIKQMYTMLLWLCTVVNHRGRQNVVKTSVTLSAVPCVPPFLFLPHFDVICDLSLNRHTATWNLSFLTLHSLASMCVFSILFSIHFLRCWQGEFVYQSREYLVGDHFIYSHDLTVWCRGYTVGRNRMLVTLRG